MTKSYDAIVIGAGHNGLTNTAFLAKAGLNGLVFEKMNTPAVPPSAGNCMMAGNTPTAGM
jgi:flavin-dependent dehydrogenase